ncbi:ABC transporter substrate-binding protein [Pseudohoeflea coraliihabitans]|uniref:Extracellular solute-binding protein n=1 Tax=Pseudohoeflea coraliihabitans TaxID=2860393 RepID=A0ABS6WJY3_9HYPH|nr:extracellular solute-binding protein [Pseudohoeflea sp. DP4N28-3]MBW3096256.1 extracellular solute-binding protein [Pseudohoeflea sp. DP4N28-3]
MTRDKIDRNSFRRRAILKGAAGVAVAGGLGMPFVRTASAQQFSGKELRVLTWSDPTGQAAVRNILQPFEAATGAKIIADLTGSTSDMIAKIRASAARPQYDLVILSGFGASALADAGLLEKPDLSAIPNTDRMFSQYRTGAKGYGVGYFLWSDGLLYNTNAHSTAPSSYDVLWDEANKGKIIVPPAENLGALELIMIAARMAGGDAQNPDSGFELLAKLKDQILTVSQNSPQMADLFRANSANAGAIYSPLLFADNIPDPAFNMSGTYDLAEGFFVDLQFMVIPKGHPGDAAAINALINQALDPEVQGKMAEEVWYGPVNQDAKLSDKAKASPYIPSPDVIANRTVQVDAEYLASVRDDWVRRYAQAIA